MLKSLRPEAKNKEKMQETSCERAELVARVESRSHHHVERWILKKPQLARRRATPKGTVWQDGTTNNETTMLYWDRTPWDLWHR